MVSYCFLLCFPVITRTPKWNNTGVEKGNRLKLRRHCCDASPSSAQLFTSSSDNTSCDKLTAYCVTTPTYI